MTSINIVVIAALGAIAAGLGVLWFMQSQELSDLELRLNDSAQEVRAHSDLNIELTSDKDSLAAKIESLKNRSAELDTVKKSLSNAVNSLNTKSSDYLDLTIKKDEIQQKLNANKTYISELEIQINMIPELEAEVRSLNKSSGILNQEKLDLSEEVAQYRVKNTNLTAENESLTMELAISEKKHNDLSTKLNSLLLPSPVKSDLFEMKSTFMKFESKAYQISVRSQQEIRGQISFGGNARIEDPYGNLALDLGEKVGNRNFSVVAQHTGEYTLFLHNPYSNQPYPYEFSYSIFTHYASAE